MGSGDGSDRGQPRPRALDRWVDRHAASAAAWLFVISIGLAALAHRFDRFPLDVEALRIAQRLGTAYEPIARVCNEHDWWLAGVALGAGVGLALWRRQLDAALLFVLALVLRWTGVLLRELVGRPRPSGGFEVRDVVDSASYPSGHVLTAMTLAGVWFVLAPELVPARRVPHVRAVLLAWVSLIAVSRMWAGAHWLSDASGAVLWGAFLTASVFAIRPAVRATTARFAPGAPSAGRPRVEAPRPLPSP